MAKATSKPVLITTEFRGVFFGYVKDEKKFPAEVTLTGVRNCIYWSSDVGGFMGLAATGPTKGCRISARVSEMTIPRITSITPMDESAAKAWDDAPVYRG